MTKVTSDILNLVNKTIENKTIIYLEAGHFNPSLGATGFSVKSFENAIAVCKSLIRSHSNQIKVVFGILIDDLGLDCGESCQEKNNNVSDIMGEKIPDEINELIENEKFVKKDRILIFSEKNSKNRGISKLRKLLKSNYKNIAYNKSIIPEEISFCNKSGDDILLARKKDDVVNLFCPGIMGQHYSDVIEKLRNRFFEASNFIIIDWSEIFDESKVVNGSMAFFKVFNSDKNFDIDIKIMNIFFGDDNGEIYKIFSHKDFENEKHYLSRL